MHGVCLLPLRCRERLRGALQRAFTRERIAALLEDRALREADAAAHGAAADAKLAELTARLTDAEVALLQTTKDHILGVFVHTILADAAARTCGPWIVEQRLGKCCSCLYTV